MKKLLLTIVIVGLLLVVFRLSRERRAALDMLEEVTTDSEELKADTEENKEKAREIVAKVKAHMLIPEGVEPTIATIVDVEALRKKNPFYEKAENGDYLVVTTDRAILYDADRDVILDVVPVQIEPRKKAGTP